MKLITNNENFQAEKIIKVDSNIVGYGINGSEVFSLKGISDFSGFILQDDKGNVIEFLAPPKTDSELIVELKVKSETSERIAAETSLMLQELVEILIGKGAI